jgi:hypothetical protein
MEVRIHAAVLPQLRKATSESTSGKPPAAPLSFKSYNTWSAILSQSGAPLWRMFRKSGGRFSDKDMHE